MVPFRMRGAQRAAGKDDEMVLSGLSEEVGGRGEGAGAWWGWGWWRSEGREEEVRGFLTCGGSRSSGVLLSVLLSYFQRDAKGGRSGDGQDRMDCGR